jgi:hypothetical protein
MFRFAIAGVDAKCQQNRQAYESTRRHRRCTRRYERGGTDFDFNGQDLSEAFAMSAPCAADLQSAIRGFQARSIDRLTNNNPLFRVE